MLEISRIRWKDDRYSYNGRNNHDFNLGVKGMGGNR